MFQCYRVGTLSVSTYIALHLHCSSAFLTLFSSAFASSSKSKSYGFKEYHIKGLGSSTKTVMTRASSCGQLPSVATDIPHNMGGQDSAHQPIETFMSSLCGCEMVTALYVASKMSPKVVIENIEFDGIVQIFVFCFYILLI